MNPKRIAKLLRERAALDIELAEAPKGSRAERACTEYGGNK